MMGRYPARRMPMTRPTAPARVRAWLDRWAPLLPLLAAEFIVMVGFGALLPVLPLYVQDQGIDATTLGIIIAAWPIAKLISEPIFGWWADRHSRKPQMIAGLVILGIANVLPFFFTSAVALFALRFVAGAATGLYDPAARGMIVEATDEDERGEAFGFYGAFQIGGFAVGPVIGAFGTALFGGYAFPFFFTGAFALVGALVIYRYVPRHPRTAEDARRADGRPTGAPLVQAPLRALVNRPLIAALVLAFGLHLSFGTYEVVWTLYLIALGATITWVGVTFVLFAIPEMIIAPIAGRYVDRKGPIRFVIGSSGVIIFSGVVYAVATEPVLPSLVVPLEAAATAAMTPALFAMVARGSPTGRSSTAQGLYGAVTMLAIVVASVVAGALFEADMAYPFWFFIVGMVVTLAIGLLVYRGAAATSEHRSIPVRGSIG
jgi:MFS transporter, DHA1 family, multidrug resistance protein